MKQEHLLIPILLAIIFVSILGNIYFYFHQNSNLLTTPFDTSILITPTPTWKTYYSNQHPISVEYPANWRADVDQFGVLRFGPPETISFSVFFDNPKKVTQPYDQWFEKQLELSQEPCTGGGCTGVGTVMPGAVTTLAGVPAYGYRYGAGWSSILGYFVPFQQNVYTLEYEESDDPSLKVIYQHMLSTFKFID